MLILTILKIIGWIIAGVLGLIFLGCAILGGIMVITCHWKVQANMKDWRK